MRTAQVNSTTPTNGSPNSSGNAAVMESSAAKMWGIRLNLRLYFAAFRYRNTYLFSAISHSRLRNRIAQALLHDPKVLVVD